jgi:ABC-type lipoprotein export system ATPase subunit
VDPGRQEVAAPGGVEVLIDHVRKGFEGGRISALEDVSLHLQPGEFVSLIGPSGCGKSTLLNVIGALDTPDAGSISVGGQRIELLRKRAEYRAKTVGFVFQFHNLIPTLNALENVQVPMLGRNGSRHQREQRAADLLAEVGLSHRLRAYPGTLSGGERQRVAIARALANSPRLLLADEPTGSLDSANGIQIMNLLGRLRGQRHMTILLVTNDLAIAGIADRTLRMRDGRLEDAAEPPEAGSPEPATPGGEPRSA